MKWKVGLEDNRQLIKNTTSICDNKTVVSTLELFASHDMNGTPVQCSAYSGILLLFSKFAVLTVTVPGQEEVEGKYMLVSPTNEVIYLRNLSHFQILEIFQVAQGATIAQLPSTMHPDHPTGNSNIWQRELFYIIMIMHKI